MNAGTRNQWTGLLRRAPRLLAVAALALWVCGCEDDDAPPDFGENDPNVVVAAGDSLTQGGYPSLLAAQIGKTVIDAGHGGYQTSSGLSVVNSALSRNKPGYVLIWYGANDVIHDLSHESIIANLRTMIQAAKANKTVPIISNCTPMYWGHDIFNGSVQLLNPKIAQLASEEGITMVDMAGAFGTDTSYYVADGLHFNSAGDELVARTWAGAF